MAMETMEKDMGLEEILEKVSAPDEKEEKKVGKKKVTPATSKDTAAAKTIETFQRRRTLKEIREIEHLMGDAVKVAIKKVDDQYGKHIPIVTLNKSEIEVHPSLEDYIMQFVVPKHGRGMYVAQFLDQSNNVISTVEVNTGMPAEEEKKEEEVKVEVSEEKKMEEAANIIRVMSDIQKELLELQAKKAESLKEIYTEQIHHLQSRIQELEQRPGNETLIMMLQSQIENLRREMQAAEKPNEWLSTLMPVIVPLVEKALQREPQDKVIRDTVDMVMKMMQYGSKDAEKFEQLLTVLKEMKEDKQVKLMEEMMNFIKTEMTKDKTAENPILRFVDKVISDPASLENIMAKLSGKDAVEKQLELVTKQLESLQSSSKDPLETLVDQVNKVELLKKIFNPEATERKDTLDQLMDTLKKAEELRVLLGGSRGGGTFMTIMSMVINGITKNIGPYIKDIMNGIVRAKQLEVDKAYIERTGQLPPHYGTLQLPPEILQQMQQMVSEEQMGNVSQPVVQEQSQTSGSSPQVDLQIHNFLQGIVVDVIAGLSAKEYTAYDLGNSIAEVMASDLEKNPTLKDNILGHLDLSKEILVNLLQDAKLGMSDEEVHSLVEYIFDLVKRRLG